jgi:hypothetical protein
MSEEEIPNRNQPDWHFVTDCISKFMVSEVIDRLMKEASKLPFLE